MSPRDQPFPTREQKLKLVKRLKGAGQHLERGLDVVF
jgi:hypothetical protein